jgi:N-dimethylarginine dimethylaminohydrolase
MTAKINQTVLVSGADFFDNSLAINPYMHTDEPVDRQAVQREHDDISAALQKAGILVVQVSPPTGCQDGIYTANWALVRGDTAVLAHLPEGRTGEIPYAEKTLRALGKKVVTLPAGLRFSGQGDALPCGDYLFAGKGYRSDPEAQQIAARTLGYELIQLETIPQLDAHDQPAVNLVSGWPDSPFYDIDLALSVLKAPQSGEKALIAWCPEAFTPESRTIIRKLEAVDGIEVSLEEAKEHFACNLISTGETVIMGATAPRLKASIEARGLTVFTPHIKELSKGGGYIRCITLTI